MKEKVGRQGKAAQNVWNEPIDAPQNSWVPVITCLAEIRFSKLNIFKNDPYFASSSKWTFPQTKNTEIRVIFENIKF